MDIVFATCLPQMALEFINKMYPNRKDLIKEDIPLLYGLISKDVLRVQDPDFHQPCQIIAGNNYKGNEVEVQQAVTEFQAKIEECRLDG